MAYAFELGWGIGLFEGEGCITTAGNGRCQALKMEMTDFDVMQRFFRLVNVGNLRGPYHPSSKAPHHKPFWKWCTSKKAIVSSLLEVFIPHLCERRAKRGIEALTFYETTN